MEFDWEAETKQMSDEASGKSAGSVNVGQQINMAVEPSIFWMVYTHKKSPKKTGRLIPHVWPSRGSGYIGAKVVWMRMWWYLLQSLSKYLLFLKPYETIAQCCSLRCVFKCLIHITLHSFLIRQPRQLALRDSRRLPSLPLRICHGREPQQMCSRGPRGANVECWLWIDEKPWIGALL